MMTDAVLVMATGDQNHWGTNMFEVYESWRMPVPKQLCAEGAASYKCIRFILHTYRFIVDFSVVDENGFPMSQSVMLSDIHDVMAAVGEFDDFRISIMAPRHANADGEMSLHTVIQITLGSYEGNEAYIYKCANGKTYIDCWCGRDITEDAVADQKMVYAATPTGGASTRQNDKKKPK